jgi:hypothetical protein
MLSQRCSIVRYGTLPESASREALRQQAASIAAVCQPRLSVGTVSAQLIEEDPVRPLRERDAPRWSAKWQS